MPLFLFASALLGGASAGGYIANALLQTAAVGLLIIAWRGHRDRSTRPHEQQILLLGLATLLVLAAQFVPLPLAVWRAMPGREILFDELASAQLGFAGGTWSLAPHASFRSIVWIFPALGVTFAMLRNDACFSERGIALAIIAAMVTGVVAGALQIGTGEHSPFYFYDVTNRGFAVGFFANINHMATLLLIAIPFEAAVLADALSRTQDRQKALRTAGITIAVAGFGLTVIGIFVADSLAGYGLVLPVTFASGLILMARGRVRVWSAVALLGAALCGITFVIASNDGQQMLQDAGTTDGSRQVIFATTWEAIRTYFPTGSGLGTFVEVYRRFEEPLMVPAAYVNHAHNDYLEIALELGGAGILLIGVFAMWWVRVAWRIWAATSSTPFARAAVIASATILIHECVDYPLRTAAISTIFAVCVVLMASAAEASANHALMLDDCRAARRNRASGWPRLTGRGAQASRSRGTPVQ